MTIPANTFVNVAPSVLQAGGNPLALNCVMVDNSGDTSIPIGTVQGFPNLIAVQDWYGAVSAQAILAAPYFGGFIGATQYPGLLYFVQYNAAAVAAYIRGGTVAALTLAQIQALSGTLIITVDGTQYTTGSINLSAATSQSNAATIMQTALTTAGAPVTCTYDALRQAFVITSTVTGTGSTIGYASGTLAAGVYLTLATGAVLSQGAAATTPAACMNGVTQATQNWADFMTVSQPNLTIMEAFAAWVTAQNQQYAYINWDSAAAAIGTPPQPTCFAQIVDGYNGCISVYDSTGVIAAFVAGVIASINFNEQNGRISFAFKGQAGITPNVTNLTIYENLITNGYNAYCAVATDAQQFQFLQNGQISGAWTWIDTYINQIYFNAQFQLALMELLTQAKAIPYNTRGFSMIQAALQPVINQMGNFGAWVPGVTLSGSQIATVNAAAGMDIATTLQSVGWYLQILPPSATVRQARGSPPITFWYVDGGSVQSINMASIDIE